MEANQCVLTFISYICTRCYRVHKKIWYDHISARNLWGSSGTTHMYLIVALGNKTLLNILRNWQRRQVLWLLQGWFTVPVVLSCPNCISSVAFIDMIAGLLVVLCIIEWDGGKSRVFCCLYPTYAQGILGVTTRLSMITFSKKSARNSGTTYLYLKVTEGNKTFVNNLRYLHLSNL